MSKGWLCLSRKKDESIMIGDTIEIVVVDIRQGQVRLAIKAPPQVQVWRRELYDEIKKGR